MRRIPALIGVVVILSAALAGCAGAPGLGGCTPTYRSGDASSTVEASGKIGSPPSVRFPTPLIATVPQVSTLHAGTGDHIQRGQQVDFEFSMYSASDGDKLSAAGTAYRGTPARGEAGRDGSALTKALVCAQVGQRLAIVTEASRALSDADVASNNIRKNSTVVVIIDITAAYLGKADGFNQLPLDGMPNVVTAVDGQPAISVLLQTPPTTTRFSAIKAGGGATVKADENVVMHFSSWFWPTGKETKPADFVSTWTNGTAPTLAVTSLSDGGGLPAGMVKGLIGQKVGSQILIVIPPGNDGFPPGTQNVPDGATLIFVVDILGIQK